ncbi:MAG: SsrA-binding protein SmpB [Thermoleophilia bacterium]|jgi:SsrA-binding protein|nr:SsrA-binding protein SmpB [Thermoleophilia bacterium]
MAPGKDKKRDERFRDVAQNRKAFHDYEIVERFEAGIVLVGSEVKGLRERGGVIRDAYAQVRDGEVFLVGMHIAEYAQAGRDGHDTGRTRKLLLHRQEIERIRQRLAERGLSLIPLRLYFKEGRAKIELGLGRGKAQHDKRRAIKEREVRREMDRAVRAVRTAR